LLGFPLRSAIGLVFIARFASLARPLNAPTPTRYLTSFTTITQDIKKSFLFMFKENSVKMKEKPQISAGTDNVSDRILR